MAREYKTSSKDPELAATGWYEFEANAKKENAKRNSPMQKDMERRKKRDLQAWSVGTANQRQRGNPLSIIANEDKPNPARRMKQMALAKNNKTSYK
jgi:hypothetical protein